MTNIQTVEVDTLATGSYFSDCYPFQIIRVTPSGKTIEIRKMDATPSADFDYFSNQKYNYKPNTQGQIYTARKTKTGWKTPCGMRISIGNARKYEDPHY